MAQNSNPNFINRSDQTVVIGDPLAFLKNRANYSIVYEDLKHYFQENKTAIPQMGERDQQLVEKFGSSVRTYLYQKLGITTQNPPPAVLEQVEIAVRDLSALFRGYGPLQDYLMLPGVEEIIVRNGSILIERYGQVNVVVDNSNRPAEWNIINSQFHILANRVADMNASPLSTKDPYAVITVPDTQDRFGVIIEPLSYRGVAINVRVFPKGRPMMMTDLQSKLAFADADAFTKYAPSIYGNNYAQRKISPMEGAYWKGRNITRAELLNTIDDDEARKEFEKVANGVGWEVGAYLATLANYNLANVLVSGEFGSGKTTLLNAMGFFIPRETQVIVMEGFYELQIPHKFALRCVTGKIYDPSDILNLVITRMRPDLVVVGELVGPEAVQFLAATNLGKKAMSTIHSNSALDALYRLEDLVISHTDKYGIGDVRRRITNLDVIIHTAKEGRDRFVNEIMLLENELDDRGHYKVRPLFKSGRRGERTTVLQALWTGLKENDAESKTFINPGIAESNPTPADSSAPSSQPAE